MNIYDDNYLTIDKEDDGFRMYYSADGDGVYYRGNKLSKEQLFNLALTIIKHLTN